jgi:TRAP transporter TAXI family solute receptor
MKKNRLIWLIFLLIPLVLALCACEKEAVPEQKPVEDVKQPQPGAAVLRLIMSTGATSGNYYPFGAALAQVVGEASNYLVLDVQPSVDATENLERLASGETQLALLPNDILSYAYYATGIWQDKPPVASMAPLMTLYPEICQVVVGANSGLTGVEDLKGKKVAIGEEGTALQASALKILEICELTGEDVELLPLSFADAAQALREKTIDALFVTVGTPNKGMMDLQADREIAILGLDDKVIDALLENSPFYTRYTLDENDYSFLTEPVNTVAIRVTLVAAASLSEQTAYDLVKAIIENRDKIAVAHAKGMFINAEDAVSGLPLDLHAGAQRYFVEIGALEGAEAEALPEDVEPVEPVDIVQ